MLNPDSCKKHDSKTFFIYDIFYSDEYFSQNKILIRVITVSVFLRIEVWTTTLHG